MSTFDDIFKERLRKSFLVALESIFNQKFDKINERPIELRKQIKRKADFLFQTSQNGINSLVHITPHSIRFVSYKNKFQTNQKE